MKNTLSAKRWIASFFALTFLILLLLSGFAYWVDPYFQFRAKDNTYFLSAPYVNAGLVRNYEYDTLIIGSCMIGNFNMDRFRDELHVNPLKVESGGLGPDGIAAYLRFAADAGKASRYIVNIDLATFQSAESAIPNEYLMKDDLLSRAKYLLGYETWFRFLPVDCGLMLYKTCLGEFPPGKLSQRTSIDENGAWNLSERFGRDIVVHNRLANQYEVSEVDLNGLYDRLIFKIDRFLSGIDFDSASFTFIFPPYSALYWCDAQDLGYFDTFLAAKNYFIQQLLDRNCTVYDFQAAEETCNLDYYKDSTHYSSALNHWMTDCFVRGDYLVTKENCELMQKKLIETAAIFRAENPDLFS